MPRRGGLFTQKNFKSHQHEWTRTEENVGHGRLLFHVCKLDTTHKLAYDFEPYQRTGEGEPNGNQTTERTDSEGSSVASSL